MKNSKLSCLLSPVFRLLFKMINDVKYIVQSMRPKHWVKNLFIFAGLIFSHNLLDLHLLARVATGFIFFSLAASSIYILNDIRDAKRDKEHPDKKTRPIASGKLEVKKAFGSFLFISLFALGSGFIFDLGFFLILAAYVLMNIAYSLRIKQVVILDVMCIAFGFALRVFAGTTLAGVSPSDWLIICTITLSLFLGFSKRRHELASISPSVTNHRKVLTDYSTAFLDQMIAIASACTVMSYALYTIANETVGRFGTRNLVFTIPFVIYGIYRYLYLIHQKKAGGNPTTSVLTDLPLLLNGLIWIAAVLFIIYF